MSFTEMKRGFGRVGFFAVLLFASLSAGCPQPAEEKEGGKLALSTHVNVFISGGFAQDEVTVVYKKPLPTDEVILTQDAENPGKYTAERPAGIPAGSVIHRITAGEHTHLLGRKDDKDIFLNIDSDEKLKFRDEDDAGYIPIGSYAEFHLMTLMLESLDWKFKQDADLDLLGEPPENPGDSSWNGENWTEIGTFGIHFTGEFDGGIYTIENLHLISASVGSYTGLFGFVGDTGKIRNVHIESGFVESPSFVGGIAGRSSGEITGCYNKATVQAGNGPVGGIVGYNVGGIITNCYNAGNIQSIDKVGGIIGESNTGTIIGCYNTGAVQGSDKVGGILGLDTYGNVVISPCYWDSSALPAPANGIGAPASNTNAEPFSGAANFPDVSAIAGWKTSSDGTDGYWKPGTTAGGQLPRPWWEE